MRTYLRSTVQKELRPPNRRPHDAPSQQCQPASEVYPEMRRIHTGVVLCSCRDPGDLCPSLILCGCGWLHSRSKFLAKRRAAMVSRRQRGSPGSRDRIARRKCWRTPSRLTGERSGFASFVSGTNVWTRWRCRRCYSNIPAGLQGKYRQATSAKTRRWSS